MGFMDGLKQLFPRLGSRGNPRLETMGSRKEPPIRGTKDFLESYDSSPWVRAMAGRVAQGVANTTWFLERTDRGGEVKRHLMLETMRRPNPLMSGTALFRVSQLSLDLTGDFFWLYQRNDLGAPFRYWPVPPHWVESLPTVNDPNFKIQWESWSASIPEPEMLWIHEPSPASPYGRGRGIVQALADEVSGDEYASKHANVLFFNRAMPDVVVMDPNASEPEIRTHEHAWAQRLQGLYKAMRPYFTNRQLEFWQPQQMNLENLTLVPMRTYLRDIQLQCWGIPPEQIGIIENSNRATAEASDYIMETRVIAPRRQFLAEELTLKLATQYDERLELRYRDATPRDKEFELKVMKSLPSAFEVNDVRELVGKDRWDGPEGKARLVPMNMYATTDLLDVAQRPQAGGQQDDEEEEETETEEEVAVAL